MKKSIESLLKRDLVMVPQVMYFVVYFLYLFFERILEKSDYAVLVKPIIIPIVVFLYITNKSSKRQFLNLILLLLIFISDNSTLLEIRSFYIYATIMYMLSVYILLYHAVLDMKYFIKRKHLKKKVGIVLFGVFGVLLFYWLINFNPNDKVAEKFIVFEYLIIFVVLFLLSVFNYIQLKAKKNQYLFLTLLCLFLSNLFFSVHRYYDGHIIFKYLICFVEVPVYYFLLKYLLKKDKELIEQ